MILENPQIRGNYKVSGNSLPGYGILILSKFDCIFREVKYEESMMMRSLLIAEPIGADYVVMTSHFESLNNPKCRSL
jgi:hypothetical protein